MLTYISGLIYKLTCGNLQRGRDGRRMGPQHQLRHLGVLSTAFAVSYNVGELGGAWDLTYVEACIYKKVSGSSVAFMVLYVDDILLIGNDIEIDQYA